MKTTYTLPTGIVVDVITAHLDHGADNVLKALEQILPKRGLFIGDTGCDSDFVYYIANRELTASELIELNKKIFV